MTLRNMRQIGRIMTNSTQPSQLVEMVELSSEPIQFQATQTKLNPNSPAFHTFPKPPQGRSPGELPLSLVKAACGAAGLLAALPREPHDRPLRGRAEEGGSKPKEVHRKRINSTTVKIARPLKNKQTSK